MQEIEKYVFSSGVVSLRLKDKTEAPALRNDVFCVLIHGDGVDTNRFLGQSVFRIVAGVKQTGKNTAVN